MPKKEKSCNKGKSGSSSGIPTPIRASKSSERVSKRSIIPSKATKLHTDKAISPRIKPVRQEVTRHRFTSSLPIPELPKLLEVPEGTDERASLLKDTVMSFIKDFGEYTNKLGYLLKFYIQPLRTMHQPVISKSDQQLLFGILEDLVVLSRTLYVKLKERGRPMFAKEPSPPRFGDVYIKMSKRLNCYGYYAFQYDQVVSHHRRLVSTKPAYEDFLRSTRARIAEWGSERGKTIPSFQTLLELPLSVLMSHAVFLENVARLSENQHDDEKCHSDLTRAAQEVSGVVDFTSACFEKTDVVMDVVRVEESLKGLKSSTRLLRPGCVLVRDEMLKTLPDTQKPEEKKEKLRVIILTKAIIIAESMPALVGKKQRSIVRYHWPCKHVTAIDMADSITKGPGQRYPGKNKFKLRYHEETRSSGRVDVVFRCEDKASKLLWMKELKSVLSGATLKSTTAHFTSVLLNRQGKELFMNFLKSEYSEENLQFWFAVRTWKMKHSRSYDAKDTAHEVYQLYVRKGSEREINLPNKYFSILKGIFEDGRGEITPETFDEAQNNIFRMMEGDSYKRFIKTEEYVDFIMRVKDYRRDKAKKSMLQNIGM